MDALVMTRTENDVWDLATSVGVTATLVAAFRAAATRRAAAVITDPYAEPLVDAVGVEALTRLARGEFDITEPGQDAVFANMTDYFVARTRFFDDFYIDAGRAGIRQAVILASGLDSRAYRLPWPTDGTVYEIDQPAVIEFKTAVLARRGAAPLADRRVVGVDLRHDWPAALIRAGLDPTRPTAWIAEGLLMYLSADARDRLLDNITNLSARGSRFACEGVFDIARFGALVGNAHRRMDAITVGPNDDALGVDLQALLPHSPRNDLQNYLRAQGWSTTTVGTPDLFSAANTSLPPDADLLAALDELIYIDATRT
jgi:methyltransferase (TIGR00027 family)